MPSRYLQIGTRFALTDEIRRPSIGSDRILSYYILLEEVDRECLNKRINAIVILYKGYTVGGKKKRYTSKSPHLSPITLITGFRFLYFN